MTNHTLKLTDHDVLQHAQARLQQPLPIQAAGYVCTTEEVLHVLLGVAANRGTIESVCADLIGTADPETMRRYLQTQLRVEALPALERCLNAALAEEIPPRVWAQTCDVAIACHDRPYYGTVAQADGLWVRGHAKAGTTRFYRIATAYVMLHGLRVTLAMRFVLPDEDTVTVLDALLQRLDHLAVRVKRLVLAKGFASSAVMAYLTCRRQPALIACPIRGRTGGTRALCRGHGSYRTRSTFTGADNGRFTAELAVCRVLTTAKRPKRMRRRGAWLIFVLIHLDLSPRQARRQYRRRFGIESSYRCAGQVRGWTTAKNPAYRFVLIALRFILLNVWLHLRWYFTQVPRRGSRWLDTQRFPLQRFAKFLIRALEYRYGCIHEIAAPAAPQL